MKPLFLLAPMNRSGTKFFKSLLLGHRQISQGFSLEDYSMAYSHHLLEYSRNASKHWGRTPEDKGPQRERLIEKFSQCLLDFFSEGAEETGYMLLTTPRPWGVENVFTFFPNAKLLLLVRDGKDCVTSAKRSFGGPLRLWASEWSRGVQTILSFAERFRGEQHDCWDFVSFEELVCNKRSNVEKVLEFLGLSNDEFDESVFDDCSIYGSGWHGGVSSSVPMTKDFNPIGRHNSWSLTQRLTFRWHAGTAYKQIRPLVETSQLTGHGGTIIKSSAEAGRKPVGSDVDGY